MGEAARRGERRLDRSRRSRNKTNVLSFQQEISHNVDGAFTKGVKYWTGTVQDTATCSCATEFFSNIYTLQYYMMLRTTDAKNILKQHFFFTF